MESNIALCKSNIFLLLISSYLFFFASCYEHCNRVASVFIYLCSRKRTKK